MKSLALGILLSLVSLNAAADDGECGKIIEVDAFRVTVNGLKLSFPSNMEIRIDDRVIYTEEGSTDWAYPYTGLLIAVTSDHILVESYFHDCVDLIRRRLFLLTKSGELILAQVIWTGHWENAFYYEGRSLAYWSRWFCQDNNEHTSAEKSYVYIWRGNGGFKREERSYDSVCSNDGIAQIMRRKIGFAPLESPEPGAD